MSRRIGIETIFVAQKSLPDHVLADRMPRLQTFGFAKATSELCIRELLTPRRLFPCISKSEVIEIEDRDSSQTRFQVYRFRALARAETKRAAVMRPMRLITRRLKLRNSKFLQT